MLLGDVHVRLPPQGPEGEKAHHDDGERELRDRPEHHAQHGARAAFEPRRHLPAVDELEDDGARNRPHEDADNAEEEPDEPTRERPECGPAASAELTGPESPSGVLERVGENDEEKEGPEAPGADGLESPSRARRRRRRAR